MARLLVTGIAVVDLIFKPPLKSVRAFSLIEILLVIALLALLAGVVAGNLGAFIQGANFEPPERVLKKAVLDAVYFSSERKRATYLSYYEDNATFQISDSMGVVLAQHKVYQRLDDGILEGTTELPKVSFTAVGPLSGVDGDSTEYEEEDLYLKRVLFHAGSSIPFKAEILFAEQASELFFDPFSGYVLKQKE